MAPRESFDALAKELRHEFPTTDVRSGMLAQFKVENGRVVTPTAEDLGFQGIHLRSEDGTVLVQFRPDGFTYNNLMTYMGGDRLLKEALRLWSKFVVQFEPTAVTRVALRYINQLRLPFKEGDEFSRFLTASPVLPPGSLQTVSQFLTRVVAHDAETSATVITTQQLTHANPGEPLVVIDLEASRQGDFSTSVDELRTVLDGLRALKNSGFFSLLTDEAIGLYL